MIENENQIEGSVGLKRIFSSCWLYIQHLRSQLNFLLLCQVQRADFLAALIYLHSAEFRMEAVRKLFMFHLLW